MPNGRLRQEVEDKLQLCSASNRDKLQTATDLVTKKTLLFPLFFAPKQG